MTTAIQNIEREKGARIERRAIACEIHKILKSIGNRSTILNSLLDWIKERDR